MKILGIVCSPRKGGNTEVLMGEALAAAKSAGAEVEITLVAGKNLSPCDGCESCRKTGKCHIKDDMQDILASMVEADGIIFGSPVYVWNITAQAKMIVDRTFSLRAGRKLKSKVAGIITVARRTGNTNAFSALADFATTQGMVSCSGAMSEGAGTGANERGGGAIAYGDGRGDVRNDERGMAEARALGLAMVNAIRAQGKS